MKCAYCEFPASIFASEFIPVCGIHNKILEKKMCAVCGEEPTKKMVCQIAVQPDEQTGHVKYIKVTNAYTFFCDKHSFAFESVIIGKKRSN